MLIFHQTFSEVIEISMNLQAEDVLDFKWPGVGIFKSYVHVRCHNINVYEVRIMVLKIAVCNS